MSLSFEEVNTLGNLINDTFGKSSTTSPYPSRLGKYDESTVATKSSLQGDQLCVTSLCIKNLGPHGYQHQVISDTEGELDQRINKYMSELKKDFKKKENAGRALKTKEDKNKRSTDVQMINHYAETRQAYIFRRAYFEVS
jgi:hypothetical protein|tara:strand:- start:8150 stop:8569 length:420 start_codon:yes stop_codon:yes gene_type:complete